VASLGAPLTSRKVEITVAVVREHIRTREPVGSQAVQGHHRVQASTATIRNEMMELERAGYLRQPHTSAGRVPCDPAYRLYVNHLSNCGRPEPRHVPWLKGEYRRLGSEPHELLRATSRLLARATAHPTVVTQPAPDDPALTGIALQPVSATTVRLAYRTSDGLSHDHLLRSEVPVTAGLLAELTEALQRLFGGQAVSALAGLTPTAIQARMSEHQAPSTLVDAVRQAVADDDPSAVYVDGASYILDEPEFEERGRLRMFMQTLDEDGALRQVMRDATEASEVTVTIGAEHRLSAMTSCSLVASSYVVRGVRGAVGVLGPTRMDYGEVMGMVEFAARKLSEVLSPNEE